MTEGLGASGGEGRSEPVAELEWPPTEADLRRLYLDEKLSAAKIAQVYGLKTPNPGLPLSW
jgi:hypothetical protein